MANDRRVPTMKIARISAGLSQKNVADEMGMHEQTYAKYEKHPELMSIKDAKLFSRIVHKDVSDIFFGSDSN